MSTPAEDVIVVGGGIGGLTLALMLHRAKIPCRVYEAAPDIKPVGVGINLLPHAVRELAQLGLESDLTRVGITTAQSRFYNRFGQVIHTEPLGRFAGYPWPQLSIHRGDLHKVLLDAVCERVGAERVKAGWRCIGIEQTKDIAFASFENPADGQSWPVQRGRVVVGCDGIHSIVRKQLYPNEGPPLYSGVNMWRGVTRHNPILSGADMIRIGWLTTGKLVIYPIRNNIDVEGRQLINWVAEIETPKHEVRDWNRAGKIEDFIDAFADWKFDWLDVPEMLRASDMILEFPMVDQEPLPKWSFGRITLLGDAAHPMYPRGSNGAGQAILDARVLADSLAHERDPIAALRAYEQERLPLTSQVVKTNRESPPDAILREVYIRTGDKPFKQIEDVISREELVALSERYKHISGYSLSQLRSQA